MRETGGTGTDSGGEVPPAGPVPPHRSSFIPDPDSLRAEAIALMEKAASFAEFELAERVLMRALGMDPGDITGQTRYLLGLACFHQQHWKDAEVHLRASLRNPLASGLLERVRINLRTGIERDADPLPVFDPAALRKPAACALNEPSLSGAPLPAEEKGNLFMRLAHAALSYTAGRIAEGAVLLAWLARDRRATFDFESWDRRGKWRGLLELGGRRHQLNHKLQSNGEGMLVGGQAPGQLRPQWTERFRSATGAWTTDDPLEGAAGTEIQRSGSPLAKRRNRIDDPDLPSAREVSRFLLAPQAGRARREVPFLNLFAIAWIQAQVHDWASHKPGPVAATREIALAPEDPLRERYGIGALRVPLSANNPLAGAKPLTYLSEVTHWWDASHLYGSDQQTQDRLRRADDSGELRIDGDLLPLNSQTGIEDTGFTRNWWLGLDLIHTLFVKHHNHLCAELRSKEGARLKTGDEIFHTARLINCAIMAKIHTVEWTPAVLPNRKLVFGMETNWWGLIQAWWNPVSRRQLNPRWEPRHHVVGGICAGARDNYGKPYAMTEEFTEVYRLHAGVPDEVRILEGEPVPTDATRGDAARGMVRSFGMARLLASFGHQHMPALENNNYPAFMCEMSVHGQPVVDIGTIDIFRARERGVPPYNEFRRMLGLNPVRRFEDLGCSAETVETLETLYGKGRKGVDRLDLLAGTSCELWRPENFGFGETMFTIFIQMASRRLHADPFYTEKFNERYYTATGMELIKDATFKKVLLTHYEELEETGLGNVKNAFEPWGTTACTHPHEHPLAQIVEY